MTTRTVYRVEHEAEGYGPYLKFYEDEYDKGHTYSSVHDEVAGLHSAHERSRSHPGPRQDGLGWDMSKHHVHGFDSRELLDVWFRGFKLKLKDAGFVVRVYEALEESAFTGESGRQCIFVKADSRVVDTQSVIAYSR